MVFKFQHALFWTRRGRQKCGNEDPPTIYMMENDLSRKSGAHAILSREGIARDAFEHRRFAGRLVVARPYGNF